MKTKLGQQVKNNKGDCSKCSDHGICCAEIDKDGYWCCKNKGNQTK